MKETEVNHSMKNNKLSSSIPEELFVKRIRFVCRMRPKITYQELPRGAYDLNLAVSALISSILLKILASKNFAHFIF